MKTITYGDAICTCSDLNADPCVSHADASESERKLALEMKKEARSPHGRLVELKFLPLFTQS